MTVKRVLILAPVILIILLIQSYFWIPTYDEQTRGNPERLHEFITASTGDASILNPILSADSASSQIESMVFEGLIDRGKDLRFRGRLAVKWDIFEEAYFYVNESAVIPSAGKASAESVADLIRDEVQKTDAISDPGLKAALDSIKEVSVLPPSEFTVTKDEKGDKGDRKIDLHVNSPARIKLVLAKVDQDLFRNLTKILGKDYFSFFQGEKYLTCDSEIEKNKISEYANEILPSTEHNPVLVFYLRPDIRFHDGHVFDAHDVKFTYDAIMNPKNLSPRIADYEPVKGVEVIDPLTVRIVYKRLYSPALATWGMGILPEHLLNEKAIRKEAVSQGKDPQTFSIRQSSFNRHPIGCGPFQFVEWKSDQYITLDRFNDYWEGTPNYKKYVFRIVPDLLTQEMEFYAGTVDNYGVQPYQVKRLKSDPRFQSFSGVSFGYTYIGYNMRRSPFDDLRVRLALGMAIDVDKIISYVLYGEGERITGPFVKQTDFYNRDIKPVPYNPEGALALLKEAGWEPNRDGWLEKSGKRLQFTLITNSGNDLRKAILAIAQDSWKQIGIDVSTDIIEWSVFIKERVNKADFDALILGWSMGIEPDLYQIWHSSQTHPYELNFVGYENDDVDDLIIKIRQEYDHAEQVKYCHSLHEIIAREQPYTFLYVNKWTAVLDKRIVIMKKNDQGDIVYEKIEPTKTGNYLFDFNKWAKIPESPVFAVD
ncbi:MAG TPA: ABC transporter substrate-binding protein [Desulfobacteraceae bacterium]|nr:ABC transporter substrate-binding protein [Desulfobacteraceae bacterium]HPJ67368.1 ABC transporter substrate-binding protein [Desulfobacteraceae bacterium]HPQ28127.1 ABC transporter substrate-binding protein [Desulfobacteraceae bacterium]